MLRVKQLGKWQKEDLEFRVSETRTLLHCDWMAVAVTEGQRGQVLGPQRLCSRQDSTGKKLWLRQGEPFCLRHLEHMLEWVRSPPAAGYVYLCLSGETVPLRGPANETLVKPKDPES